MTHHRSRRHSREIAALTERAASERRAHVGSCAEHRLTPREQEAVTLLANGLTNKEISARMGVSVNTVKAFLRSVMLKFDVTTRAGIVGRLLQERDREVTASSAAEGGAQTD
jgi:DNA-binding CsgD family transcriptional regulator